MLKFDEVKAAVDLRDYCEANLESRGRGFYVCPKCDSGNGRNHSAAFKVTGDRWHCFSCGASGDIFDLAGVLHETTDRRAQLQAVASWAGIVDGEPVKAVPRKTKAQPVDYTEGRAQEAAYIAEARKHIEDRSRGLPCF